MDLKNGQTYDSNYKTHGANRVNPKMSLREEEKQKETMKENIDK
jgi:hypothetical protein